MPVSPTTALWWQDKVIYQIYPRSFMDSNNDGTGDLKGIADRLEYLQDLGIGAVWLSPFYPSPMKDFGYDISNYNDVDPIFGTLADFDVMLEKAHSLGIKVLVDFVPNHSSDLHPWFIESRSSRDNPKHDWYYWRDAKPDGSLPNNWLSVFGGPAWTWDETRQQYYLHSFLAEQPDLNWRNPEVKAAMFGVAEFWLKRGVDGFRIDVAPMIMKDPDLRDNPPNPNPGSWYKSWGEYDSLLHIYNHSHSDIHPVYRELRALLDRYSTTAPRAMVGEIHSDDLSKWVTYYGAELDELHLPFNFGLLWAKWRADQMRASVDKLEAALPEGAWPNYVLGNHDEPRIASRVGREQARAAMLMLLTLRGTPTMYYGDELGMEDGKLAPEDMRDPVEILKPGLGLGRDPERTPMQWDDQPNAGFSAAGVKTWLPVAQDYETDNVAAQSADPHSMLNLTRLLLRYRNQYPALAVGNYRPLDNVPADTFVYLRSDAAQSFLVAINFSAQEQVLNLAENFGSGRMMVSTALDREGEVELGQLSLRAYEGCLIQLI